MPLCRKTVTPRALAARQANARKSTGPRSAAGKRRSASNGRPFGAGAPAPLRSMLALEEDPREYQHRLDELLTAHRPANAAQRMLVEDIALLRWRKLRNQRAQEGLTLKSLERLERDRLQQEADMEKQCSDFSQKKAFEMGMFNIPDSPPKFKELARLVDMFLDAVERREFTEEGYRLMASVYGPEPSTRGVRILTAYHALADSGGEGLPDVAGSEDGEQAVVTPEADQAGSESDAPAERGAPTFDEQYYHDLQLDLLEERRDINEKYLTYLQNHVPSVASVRTDAVTPSAEEWPMLIRQEQSLDREIERKTKLLLYMQWAQRSVRRNGTSSYTLKKGEAD